MLNPHFHLNKNWQTDPKQSIRAGFGDALVELAHTNEKIVGLTADLAESTQIHKFAKEFSDSFYDVGVAEQNLMGIAGGLASTGLIPFCTSYAMFSPGRNWEQLRNTVCYGNLNVKVVSTHAGLTVGPDGATHQALEDLALTRVIPNLTVISPCDYHQARLATFAAGNLRGPVYLRLSRESTFAITTRETPFDYSKAQILCYGDAVTLVSTGLMVGEALKAAKEINAEVINIHTIKPLDINTITQSVTKTHKLIVIEEHQIAGGVGSAILEAFVQQGFTLPPTKLIGVPDQFGQSGSADELLSSYGLTWEHIVETYRALAVR